MKHFRVAAVVTDFGFIHCWRRNYHHDAALVRSVPGPQPPRSGAYPQRDEGSRRNGFTAQVTNQSPSIIIISFVFFFYELRRLWLNCSYSQREELPYFEATMYEILRFCGVTPGMWRNTTNDTTVNVILPFIPFSNSNIYGKAINGARRSGLHCLISRARLSSRLLTAVFGHFMSYLLLCQ